MKNELNEYIEIFSKPAVLVFINIVAGTIYYFYRLGFYHYFGIPRHYIDFNIMQYGFIFVSVSVIFPLLVYIYDRLFRKHISTLRLGVLIIVQAIATFSFFNQMYFSALLTSVFISLIKLFFLLIVLLLFLKVMHKFTHKEVFRSILLSINNFEIKKFSPNKLDKKITKLTFLNSTVILIAILSFTFLVVSLGYSRARDFDYNYLNLNNKTYIVVDQYTDKLVLLPINLKSGIVKGELTLFKMEDLNKTPLILKTIKVSGVED